MQTSRKNVKRIYVAVAIFIVFAFVLELTGVKILLFLIEYRLAVVRLIAFVFVIVIAFFILKSEAGWKGKLSIAIFLMLGVYACVCFYDFVLPTQYTRCDLYSQKLNGGARILNGKNYKISLCGTGGDDMQSGDAIRLQVFSDAGVLLASRHFLVNWNENSPNSLEYRPDRITYYDNNGRVFEKHLFMPPTALDWVRARIPLLD
ncbi:hypothetical protein NDK50_10750 [Paraburkholderia bryophila]|uniref:hypothetical protein n=1 Tax=Paraburkholderia bryophila TaxID=420952 RepID=UPI00234ABA45|nr:hypothetical protein [Paraburkholderia bryophila]WCM17973.1 hypothetical protein NDK50_10750 [Paraburkholderia bryophila]